MLTADVCVVGGGPAGAAAAITLARAGRGVVVVDRARFPRDNKQFRPHLTIARPGDRLTADELAGDLALLDGYQGPKWTVDRILLMRSHLGPHPTYDVMAEVPLIG